MTTTNLPFSFTPLSSSSSFTNKTLLSHSLFFRNHIHILRHQRVAATSSEERSDADKLVDGMDFGELCNEFECISSPSIESTARQLARDILQLRQANRALASYSLSVNYKDPLRTFTGRDKYKRPLWITRALDKPSVTIHEMLMLSTSVLRISWTIKGNPKSLGGELIIKVISHFTLNQISGQVIEHEEFWDLSASSPISQAYFWTSRRLFSTIEAGKDMGEFIRNILNRLTLGKEKMEIYPDPSGDPTKVIGINGKFPGPILNVTTNWNVLVNVKNHLGEPLFITWNGIQPRKNSWQDGVSGTNCPIPAGWNFTYQFQVKDQIGSFF